MPELDERIAHYIDSVARPVTGGEARSRAPRPRRRRPARRALIGTALAAACVAGAVAFAATRATTAPSPRVDVGNPPANALTIPPGSAHPDPHSGAPMYFAPAYVPPGYTLVRAQGGNTSGQGDTAGSSEWTQTQTWIRFNAAHDGALAALQINRGPRVIADPMNSGRSVDLVASDDREPGSVAVTVRGHSGRYLARIGFLTWEEPVGQRVAVSCSVCSLSTLQQIAGELQRKPNGDFTWPPPHDGFELEATAPGMASQGTNVRVAAYGNGHGAGFNVVVADDTQEPPLAQLFGGDTHIVDLRDTQGVAGSQVNGPSYGVRPDMIFTATPHLSVAWLEYPNVEVVVGGSGLSEQALLQIAAGVHEIGAAAWAQLGGSPDLTGTGTPARGSTLGAIEWAFDRWLDGAHPDAQWTYIQDADAIRPAILAARAANGAAPDYSGSVGQVTLLDPRSASVTYSIHNGDQTILTSTGIAILDDGTWKVGRETVCRQIAPAATCPAR